MNIDDILHEHLMQALLGKGGNPRTIFRIMMQVNRNQIFWELSNDYRINGKAGCDSLRRRC